MAYLEDAPILLSESHQIPGAVLKEILRLKPNRIILIGGTKALSESIEEQLKAVEEQLREFAEQQGQELKDFAFSLERIEGANRYATAVKIAQRIWSKTSGNGKTGNEASMSGKTVFLASGTDFPDALAIASYAARFHIPILLTESNRLPEVGQSVGCGPHGSGHPSPRPAPFLPLWPDPALQIGPGCQSGA